MTEEEAKAKCCPLSGMRMRNAYEWDTGHCLGSACMAWRWQFKPEHIPQGMSNASYCGIAGAA